MLNSGGGGKKSKEEKGKTNNLVSEKLQPHAGGLWEFVTPIHLCWMVQKKAS